MSTTKNTMKSKRGCESVDMKLQNTKGMSKAAKNAADSTGKMSSPGVDHWQGHKKTQRASSLRNNNFPPPVFHPLDLTSPKNPSDFSN